MVTIVVIALGAVLLKGFDSAFENSGRAGGFSEQEVGKSISFAVEAADVAEGQDSLLISGIRSDCLIQFVSLGDDELNSELESVLAHNFAKVVAKVISRVGMMPGQIAGINAESESTVRCIGATNHDSRHFAAEAIIKQVAGSQTGWPLPLDAVGVDVLERDVIGGVTENEFIQQRR